MEECRRLAQEGEKATRTSDAVKGIELLEKALEVGIDDYNDISLLSAIYSQLGNAYYAQKMYDKALTFHSQDLLLSRMQKDSAQQAKAYSNMSATFTMLNNFNQAISCAENVICLGRKLEDKGLECRGLYNLGLAHLQNAIQGNLENTEEMNSHLEDAVQYFESHLEIAKERKDEILCGLAIGNLGNAHFYLGNYAKSIAYHVKRLDIARAVGDKSSMRRSFTNMANANVLLGNHEEAVKCYRLAYSLVKETGRKNLEAQLLFSLGTVETLRKDYEKAIRFFIGHLHLTRQLNDNAGESRAYSSLASALCQINELSKALYFLVTNYKLAEKLDDNSMKTSTLDDIRQLIKRNSSAVIQDDKICLDASFDPENLLMEAFNFDSIGDSMSGAMRNRPEMPSADTASSPNNASALSMPNLSLSLSLESFMRDCARGSSSTPKRATHVPLISTDSIQLTSKKTQKTSYADMSLMRIPLCKSEPDIKRNEVDEEEDVNAFFEHILRVQGNQIDGQRANPAILKDRTNSNLHRNTENLNMRNISGDGLRMTLGANFKSIGHSLRKNVTKSFLYHHPKHNQSSSGLQTGHDDVSVGSGSSYKRSGSFYGTLPTLFSSSHGSVKTRPYLGGFFKKEKNKHKRDMMLNTSPSSIASDFSVQAGNLYAENDPPESQFAVPQPLNFSDCEEAGGDVANRNQPPASPTFRVPVAPAKRRAKSIKNAAGVSSTKSPSVGSSSIAGCGDAVVGGGCTEERHCAFVKPINAYKYNPETILDLIESIQGRRMNEQRADLVLPGLNNARQLLEKINFAARRRSEGDGNTAANDEEGRIDERLYELIMQRQADRLEDQRSELGGRSARTDSGASSSLITEEIVSDLVQKMQVGRLDDQRATLGSGSRGAYSHRPANGANTEASHRGGVRSACDTDTGRSGAENASDGANSNRSAVEGPTSPEVSA